jgi:urea transport system ATP-binding protein
MAYVPQGREIIPMLTVKENLILGSMGQHPKEQDQLMEEVLHYFPALREHLNRKGGVLSGGQQQQLAIARALMAKPKLLILDEPSEGIQPNVVAEIAHNLSRIHQDKGISIFIVEQNLEFARKAADQFYIMEKGRIIEEGTFNTVSLDKIKKLLTV